MGDRPKSIGQAMTRDSRWIYTWYDTGWVSRRRIESAFKGLYLIGPEERVVPPIPHDDSRFYAFAPVEKPPEATDAE